MARALTDLRSLARSHTAMAIRTLVHVAKQKSAPPAARVMASNSLLDRGWGKPHQTVSGEDDGPIRIVIRKMLGGEDDEDPKAG